MDISDLGIGGIYGNVSYFKFGLVSNEVSYVKFVLSSSEVGNWFVECLKLNLKLWL